MIIAITATDRNGHRVARREIETGSYSGCESDRAAIYGEFNQLRPDGLPPYIFVDIRGSEASYYEKRGEPANKRRWY